MSRPEDVGSQQVSHHHYPSPLADVDPDPTTHELGEALLHTTGAWGHRMKEEFQKLSLSLPRAWTLGILSQMGQVRMGELATALGVNPRSITSMIDGLERDGYVRRVPDPNDRRAIMLELTPAGKLSGDSWEGVQLEALEQFFTPLNEAEKRQLYNLLARVYQYNRSAEIEGDVFPREAIKVALAEENEHPGNRRGPFGNGQHRGGGLQFGHNQPRGRGRGRQPPARRDEES